MAKLNEAIDKFSNGEVLILDMRPFEAYMNGHIPNSILAPYVEQRWGYEISNFMNSNGGECILLFDSEEEKNKALDELKQFKKNIDAFHYKEFLANSNVKEAYATNLTTEEFQQKAEEFQIIDVREPQEWAMGTIEGAELISLNDLFTEHERLDKSKKYAIICEHGNRSLYGAIFLADKGFEVANLAEGMEGLRRKGIV